jgi:hypothetical protein
MGGKGGRRVGLTTLSLSCADCFEIWGPQPAGTLRACPGLYRAVQGCPGLYRDCFYGRKWRVSLLRKIVTVNFENNLKL